jgi:hypothetical protein
MTRPAGEEGVSTSHILFLSSMTRLSRWDGLVWWTREIEEGSDRQTQSMPGAWWICFLFASIRGKADSSVCAVRQAAAGACISHVSSSQYTMWLYMAQAVAAGSCIGLNGTGGGGYEVHSAKIRLRLSALMDLYIHPLYVLVSKILSSILNSSASIHPLYHPLSTLSTVGFTCHFI